MRTEDIKSLFDFVGNRVLRSHEDQRVFTALMNNAFPTQPATVDMDRVYGAASGVWRTAGSTLYETIEAAIAEYERQREAAADRARVVVSAQEVRDLLDELGALVHSWKLVAYNWLSSRGVTVEDTQ